MTPILVLGAAGLVAAYFFLFSLAAASARAQRRGDALAHGRRRPEGRIDPLERLGLTPQRLRKIHSPQHTPVS